LKRKSVLPEIAVTRTEEGALLVGDRVGWKDFWLLVFFASGIALNIWAFLYGQLDLTRQIQSVVYAIVALLTFVAFERDYRNRKRLRGVSLTVRPWPLRLGDEVKAQLRVRPGSQVAAKLECLEIATKGGGKFQRTERRTLYSLDLPDAEWTFVVPDQLPPSLEVKSNRVVWQVDAMITMGEVDLPVSFELLVIPEVAR
jgi:hypothetical protein